MTWERKNGPFNYIIMKKASLSQDAIERVKIQATDVRKYLKFMYLIKNLYSGVYEYIKTTDQ